MLNVELVEDISNTFQISYWYIIIIIVVVIAEILKWFQP